MLPFISQVNLIRYLIVWQVTGPFVQLPRHFAADISQTLGTLIAESLPTQQARPWRKAAESWGSLPGEAEASARCRANPVISPFFGTGIPMEANGICTSAVQPPTERFVTARNSTDARVPPAFPWSRQAPCPFASMMN